MIVTKGYKPEEFERLLKINDACYSGIELPSPETFKDMLTRDVFVAKMDPYFGPPDYKKDSSLVIGFAICYNHGNPYLWSIAVDPAYQGRGVGGRLLREVIAFYAGRGASEISLHCKPDNPAQKLYFDQGFRVTSVSRNWYGKEGDALHMVRLLL